MKLTILLIFTYIFFSPSILAQSTGGSGGGPLPGVRSLPVEDIIQFKNNFVQINIDEIQEIRIDEKVLDSYDLKYGDSLNESGIRVIERRVFIPKENIHNIILRE